MQGEGDNPNLQLSISFVIGLFRKMPLFVLIFFQQLGLKMIDNSACGITNFPDIEIAML